MRKKIKKEENAKILFNSAVELHKQGRIAQAKAAFAQILHLRPCDSDALRCMGLIHSQENQHDLALQYFQRALTINDNCAKSYLSIGITSIKTQQYQRALEALERAIIIEPQLTQALYLKSICLRKLRREDEAFDILTSTKIETKDDLIFLETKLNLGFRVCNWENLTEDIEMLVRELEFNRINNRYAPDPFKILGFTDKPALLRQAGKLYSDKYFPSNSENYIFSKSATSPKIRIGYFSADFFNHATAHLIAELFELHTTSLFEVYGFYFGPEIHDAMRTRISKPFAKFFDVRKYSDREVSELSRNLGIDIAVDLKGYTQDGRTGIFAHRCAPVQVNYLGYPGTMGAPYIDYIIADKTIIPPESQQYYSEQVVYMPHSYQVNDSKRKISERVFSKQELGLPEAGFVFCCFNNNYKILPETFDGWMRLLKAVDGSVLWLLADNPTAVSNLRKEARARGVDPDRLVFAPRMPLDEHLARHRLADLFVDTFPCNAHTTASDALWAGLPVLTRMGQSFASRVAGSLLNAMDLPELITESQEHYEQRALELALNPDLLKQIKEKLARNRLTSPLFNAKLFARHLEAAYAQMYRRYLDGQEPDVIDVQALAYRMD